MSTINKIEMDGVEYGLEASAFDGILPVTNGGTGYSDWGQLIAALRTALNQVSSEDTIQINRGGTGATNQAQARTNLGLGNLSTSKITVSTSSPSGGKNGDIWAIPE